MTVPYSNPNDTYVPSSYVKYGHQISGQQFEATQTYAQAAVKPAIGLFALGILSLLFLNVGLLFRCCVPCCKCKPKNELSQGITEVEIKQINNRRFFITVFFFILCIVALIVDQLVYIGNESINTSYNTITSTVDSMSLIFAYLELDSIALSGYGSLLSSYLTSAEASCSGGSSTLSNLDSFVSTYNTQIDSFSTAVAPVNSKFDLVLQNLDKYGKTDRIIGMYVVWGIAIGAILMLALAQFCHSRCFMKFSMFCGMLTFLLLILFGIFWMVVTLLFGDFCMSPTENTINGIPSTQLSDILRFYSSCGGDNIIGDYIDQARNASLTLANMLPNVQSTYCPSDSNINSMISTLNSIAIEFTSVESTLSCPTIRSLWFTFINNGVCNDFYYGFFSIWVSQLVTSFFLFVLLIMGSISYQYYSDIHLVAPLSELPAHAQDQQEDDHPAGAVVAGGAPVVAAMVVEHGHDHVEIEMKDKGELL